MTERVLISFTTKQDCRKACRLVNTGIMYNYSLSCDKCDPGAAFILMSINSYVSSESQEYIHSWEKIVSSFKSTSNS